MESTAGPCCRWKKFPLVVVALAALAIGVIRATELFPDPGMRNILSLALALFASLLVFGWFLLLSRLPGRTRLVGLGALCVTIGVLAAFFEFAGFSGDMRLTWRPRFARATTPLAAAATSAATKADLSIVSPTDFPQFLGPHRDGSIPQPLLARDWDKAAPELVWKQSVGAGWAGVAIVNGYALTMEQRDAQEWVTCYEVATGKLVWSHAIDARHERVPGGVGPRSTPTVHGGRVYAMGGTGVLRCLDGSDGKLVWKRDVVADVGWSPEIDSASIPWGRSGSPLVVGDRVIVPAGGADAGGSRSSLIAYALADGEKVWTGGDDYPSYSSPTFATLDGVGQVLSVNERTVSGHDLVDGKTLWTFPWPGNTNADANVSSAIQVGVDRLFVSKGYGTGGKLVRIARAKGTWAVEPLWAEGRSLRTKFSSVAIRDGYVYGLSDGILECVDLGTGKRKWKEGRYGYGQNLRVGDTLLMLTEEGEVVHIDLTPEQANAVLGKIPVLDGTTWNPFAVAGPYLVVRNAREMACIRLPLRKGP